MRKSNKVKSKRKQLRCNICGQPATHVVIVEIREKPGIPLKEDNALMIVCDEHSKDKNFDNWVSPQAYKALYDTWKKEGYYIAKQFCTIDIKKLT